MIIYHSLKQIDHYLNDNSLLITFVMN